MTPLIWKKPAEQVIRGTPDNGRTLVIVGDHPDKWLDFGEARYYIGFGEWDCMAINAAADGVHTDYMATLHSYELGRDDHEDGHEFPLSCVHPSTTVVGYDNGCPSPRVDHLIDAAPLGGTSALFAVIAGLVLGYKTIYLCGVRLEPGTIYHDEHVVENWTLWMELFRPHLTVVGGGWLKELCDD